MVSAAKRKSRSTAPIYKFGVLIPRNAKDVKRIDTESGTTKWADAEKLELDQFHEYNTFQSKGIGGTLPRDYQRINIHWIYDVKHDLRYRARCVAGGC